MSQMPLLFSPDDLRAMTRLRAVFDPEERANPHKLFPDAKVCVEVRTPRRRAAL
jgi:FAD/FMN-containing dehydrogenase